MDDKDGLADLLDSRMPATAHFNARHRHSVCLELSYHYPSNMLSANVNMPRQWADGPYPLVSTEAFSKDAGLASSQRWLHH